MKRKSLGLLCLLLSFSGCGKLSSESPPSSSGGDSSKPASAGANPLDAVAKAMDGVRTFRARMTTSGTKAGPAEMRIDVVMPDRFHMASDQMEIIVAGSTAYLKLPTGKWQKVAGGTDMSFANIKKMQEEFKNSQQVKEIGSDTLDGVPTTVYEFTTKLPKGDKAPPGMPDSYQAKIWVSNADALPRKLEGVAPDTGYTTTVIYYDYNADITIEAPVP